MLRHEFKYFLDRRQSKRLSQILDLCLQRDKYTPYWVLSLYFDTPTFDALHEKLGGDYRRYKYRLRTYRKKIDIHNLSFEDAPEIVKIEEKSRFGELMRKIPIKPSQEQIHRLLDGRVHNDIGSLFHQNPGMAEPEEDETRLVDRLIHSDFCPNVLVIYHRRAWELDTARVTLDSMVHTMWARRTAPRNPLRYIVPPTMEILEIKYTSILPPVIEHALRGIRPVRSAISKYAHCLLGEPDIDLEGAGM